MSEDKFKISLRENGEHSFKRALESYKEYEETQDQWYLKDTIMFLHHSIELLMKEMLVLHSPYLIFEDLRDIPKKQKEARKDGKDIFSLEKSPKSVTYEVALDRVEAFLNPPELDSNLMQQLRILNRQRNQLEHYAIDADREEVVEMLETIHKPILALFERYLGPLTQIRTPQIDQIWETLQKATKNHRSMAHEVRLLMERFNGQRVSGHIFGIAGEVMLPKFDRIYEFHSFPLPKYNTQDRIRFDILAEKRKSPRGKVSSIWVVDTTSVIREGRLRAFKSMEELVQPQPVPWVLWMVQFSLKSAAEDVRSAARELDIMITDFYELEELRKLLEPSHVLGPSVTSDGTDQD